jgi:hypothetical protein
MIDTHAYYQTLKDAGFDERQADAMTKGVAGIVYGSLATKIDIGDVRTEIANVRTEMANLRAELKDEITRATQRSAGFLAAYTTFIVGIGAVVNHFVR